MADADVSAAAGEASKPLSGGRPHVDASDMPGDLAREAGAVVRDGFLGLTGVARVVASISAVALIAVLFVVLFYEMLSQNRLERSMFRDELKIMHEDSLKKWDAIRASTAAIDKNQLLIVAMTDLVREGRKTTETLTGAVRDLTAEVRKNTAEVRRRFPGPVVPMKTEEELDGLEQGLNKPAAAPAKKAG